MVDCVVNAFLTSDQVIRDGFTGKWSIVGIFNEFYVPKFPYRVVPFFVYASVADLVSDPTFEFEVLGPEMEPLAKSICNKGNGSGIFRRGARAEVGGVFTDLVFKNPGAYAVQLLVDGEVVAVRKIMVHKAPKTERST